jgi:hypothetical protein
MGLGYEAVRIRVNEQGRGEIQQRGLPDTLDEEGIDITASNATSVTSIATAAAAIQVSFPRSG